MVAWCCGRLLRVVRLSQLVGSIGWTCRLGFRVFDNTHGSVRLAFWGLSGAQAMTVIEMPVAYRKTVPVAVGALGLGLAFRLIDPCKVSNGLARAVLCCIKLSQSIMLCGW